MIRVHITPKSVSLYGHAGSAPYGEDLICAAASMLLYTLGAVLQEEGILNAMELEPGSGYISTTDPEAAAPYIRMTECGMKLLAENFPKNVADPG